MTGGGAKAGGAEGERANARSVTPHCAHLPTRPTPKFELGSQPHRFSSTRLLPSSSLPRLVLAHSPIDPFHSKRTGRDISPLTSSVCTTSICDPFLSFSLARSLAFTHAESNWQKSTHQGVLPCPSFSCGNRYQCHRRLVSRVPYPSDNRHRVLVAVLVRHAAKRLDFARIPYSSLSCGIGANARPDRPSGTSSRCYFARKLKYLH